MHKIRALSLFILTYCIRALIMVYFNHGKGRNPETVAAGMAAEKADSAGLEPLRPPQTRKPHDTGLTFPESDGTASERRADATGRRTAPKISKEGRT